MKTITNIILKGSLVLTLILIIFFMTGITKAIGKEVIVGVVGDLSGPIAPYGNDNLQAVEIAADEINKAGGINGVKVVLKVYDEKNDPVEAVKIAQRVADECVAVIIGSASGCALAAGPYYERAGVPFTFTVSSNIKVTTSGWKYVNRVQLDDPSQIRRLTEYAVKKLGITSIALLHDTTDFGLGSRDAMIKIFQERGDVKLATIEAWKVTDVDFSTQVLKAQKSGAKAVWTIGAADGCARMVKQADNMGWRTQFLANTSVGNQKFLDLAGATAEGMTITWGVVDPKNPRVPEIDRKMKERYNRYVDVFVCHAYDAMYVLADAMKRAGTTSAKRPDIQKAIRTGSYNYSLGPLSFDKDGHNIRHISIAKVVKGKFEIID